jgi:hypothetical protein
MKLHTELYQNQLKRWPASGRHILSHFDDATIVVYQAYRPGIGLYAVRNQHFGGEFSFSRMSWIKPNFLWMMYRSGWGTKEGQEVTLASRLCRPGFDEILAQAVHSSFIPEVYGSHARHGKNCWQNPPCACNGTRIMIRAAGNRNVEPFNSVSREKCFAAMRMNGSSVSRIFQIWWPANALAFNRALGLDSKPHRSMFTR